MNYPNFPNDNLSRLTNLHKQKTWQTHFNLIKGFTRINLLHNAVFLHAEKHEWMSLKILTSIVEGCTNPQHP